MLRKDRGNTQNILIFAIQVVLRFVLEFAIQNLLQKQAFFKKRAFLEQTGVDNHAGFSHFWRLKRI
jgi:hypothetical protein